MCSATNPGFGVSHISTLLHVTCGMGGGPGEKGAHLDKVPDSGARLQCSFRFFLQIDKSGILQLEAEKSGTLCMQTTGY